MIASIYLQTYAIVSVRDWILLSVFEKISVFSVRKAVAFAHVGGGCGSDGDYDGDGDRTFIENLLYPRLCFNQFTCIS